MLAHPITLFVDGYFTSTWDAACYVTLIEKQLEFTTARALLRDGQGVPAALRQHTAIARIPAFQHGDFLLTESLAIEELLHDRRHLAAVAHEAQEGECELGVRDRPGR